MSEIRAREGLDTSPPSAFAIMGLEASKPLGESRYATARDCLAGGLDGTESVRYDRKMGEKQGIACDL
jgi:hypothetical protein